MKTPPKPSKRVPKRKSADAAAAPDPEYQGRLRALTSELSRAEERDRRRIAFALHDGLGQLLALAKIKLGSLRRTIQRNEAALAAAQVVQDLLSEAIAETRRLTAQLSPPVLHSLGLEPALEWLIDSIRKPGVEMSLHATGTRRTLNEDVESVLFHGARELLSNALKHAAASNVIVGLNAAEAYTDLRVEDDGRGFGHGPPGAPSKGDPAGGVQVFGLFNLRTRVENLGGTVTIAARPGGGSVVSVRVPRSTEPAGTGQGNGADTSRARERSGSTHDEHPNPHPPRRRPPDRPRRAAPPAGR